MLPSRLYVPIGEAFARLFYPHLAKGDYMSSIFRDLFISCAINRDTQFTPLTVSVFPLNFGLYMFCDACQPRNLELYRISGYTTLTPGSMARACLIPGLARTGSRSDYVHETSN